MSPLQILTSFFFFSSSSSFSLNIWFKVPFGTQESKFILFLRIYSFQLDSTLFNNSMRSVRNKKGAVVSQLCSSAVSEWHCSLSTGNKRGEERSGQRAWKWINQLKISLVTDLWSKERYIISLSHFAWWNYALKGAGKEFHHIEHCTCLLDLLLFFFGKFSCGKNRHQTSFDPRSTWASFLF